MIDRSLLTANDFIGVRAALVRELGNNADRALVLTRIYYRADERWREAIERDGQWWWRATRETIAEETGLSVDQVKRIVSWLVENGYVQSVAHQVEGSWDQTRSLRVDVGAVSPNGRAESPEVGAESPQSIGAESHNLPTIKTTKTRDIAPERFDVFYGVWPRRVGRPAAMKAWAKAVAAGHLPETIIAGALRYREWALKTGQEPRFIPHPATWLNREGWNDELAAPRPVPVLPTGRKLTAVERNLQEFEGAWPEPEQRELRNPSAAEVQRSLAALDAYATGTSDVDLPVLGAQRPEYGEPPTIVTTMHHAVVRNRTVDPQDTRFQVYIACPECESEWGWRWDESGATADLQEQAALHNRTGGMR